MHALERVDNERSEAVEKRKLRLYSMSNLYTVYCFTPPSFVVYLFTNNLKPITNRKESNTGYELATSWLINFE